jgi:GT2 family glycosyltransferase
VSVVVPTRNRAAHLREVLDPLLADPATDELVVVDDGSTDDTPDLLARVGAVEPRLQVLRREGIGAAAARQAGVEAATGTIVVFVDDDVVAVPGLVSGHRARHAAADADDASHDGDLVVVGWMPVRLPQRRRCGDAALLLYEQDYQECCASWERDPAMILTRFWNGNVSLRRERVLRVPVPSPHAPIAYHEDEDFGLRLAAAGATAAFDRSLRAEHHYHRPHAAFVLDAYRQGADRWHLRRAFPDLEDRLGWTIVPRPLPLADHRWAQRALLAIALVASRLGGWLHLWRLETDSLRLARRLERRRGYLDADRGVPSVASR